MYAGYSQKYHRFHTPRYRYRIEREASEERAWQEPRRRDAQPFMAPHCMQERYGLWR